MACWYIMMLILELITEYFQPIHHRFDKFYHLTNFSQIGHRISIGELISLLHVDLIIIVDLQDIEICHRKFFTAFLFCNYSSVSFKLSMGLSYVIFLVASLPECQFHGECPSHTCIIKVRYILFALMLSLQQTLYNQNLQYPGKVVTHNSIYTYIYYGKFT